MSVADPRLPTRLLAGGGPSTPDSRVLRALTTPLIGQFDPDFTALMDDVGQLARQTFLTDNVRCFAVSGLASAGLEAVLNSALEEGDRVAIGGGVAFASKAADIARRLGLHVVSEDEPDTGLLIVPFIDPTSAEALPIQELANTAHSRGARILVDATLGLAARELRVDDWNIDACVAGVDYALGAPPGMALVTYTPEIEARMTSRATPPRTSYLDLVQLQAYWSPERLNHHTAPTSLVYGLREALRLVHDAGLVEIWRQHSAIGQRLREGLESLGLDVHGDIPFSIVNLPSSLNEAEARQTLLDDFGVYVTPVGSRAWRLGLLGADARPDAVHHVLGAIRKVLAG
jgi:aspartate aminotransferase-like enzyme